MMATEHQRIESLPTQRCDIKLVMEDTEDQLVATKTKTKGVARDIIADMLRMNFSQDIKDRANLIHSRMIKKIRRTERRLQMIFYCIYSAHQEMKISADPKLLAHEIGMPVRNITKALSTFSQSQTGYEPPNKFHTPSDFIPDICISFNIAEERIPEIVELSDRIVSRDKSLHDEKPQKIAMSIIDYWMKISGIVLDKPTRALLFGNTLSSSDTISKRIQAADNSCEPTKNDEKHNNKITGNKITIIIKSTPKVSSVVPEISAASRLLLPVQQIQTSLPKPQIQTSLPKPQIQTSLPKPQVSND